MSQQNTEELVYIHTDGACVPNPGKGGWGVVLQYKSTVKELSGSENATTNNRMELTAAINALNALTRPCSVVLYSDSRYVIDGITAWLPNWKKKGKTNYLNEDLWMALDQAAARHSVTWSWVKAHSGNIGNERADWLAATAIKG